MRVSLYTIDCWPLPCIGPWSLTAIAAYLGVGCAVLGKQSSVVRLDDASHIRHAVVSQFQDVFV